MINIWVNNEINILLNFETIFAEISTSMITYYLRAYLFTRSTYEYNELRTQFVHIIISAQRSPFKMGRIIPLFLRLYDLFILGGKFYAKFVFIRVKNSQLIWIWANTLRHYKSWREQICLLILRKCRPILNGGHFIQRLYLFLSLEG